MAHYKRMTIFQNLDRTRTLVRFRKLTELYFQNVDHGAYGLEVVENVLAKRTRSQLNLMLEKVKRALSSVEISSSVAPTRRLPVGERQGDMDLVENIFSLHQQKVDPQILADCIERAIGLYRNDRFKAWMRTLNPLYWLNILLDYAARLPLYILGSLGLDRDKLEGTAFGKFLKGCFRMAGFVALLVVVLHYLSLLDPVKTRLQGLLAHLKSGGQEVYLQLEQRTDELILKLQDSSRDSMPEDQDPAP